MLTRSKALQLGKDYLLKNNYPIDVTQGNVIFSEDSDIESEKKMLKKKNLAAVSFISLHYDDPNDEHPFDPGLYIVYVELDTGKVHMPRHM